MTRKKIRSEEERERERAYQKEYYRKNREILLAKRKEKYETDREYREAGRARDRRRYWLKERPDEAAHPLPEVDRGEIRPTGTIPICVGSPEAAETDVPVYGTPQVATILGRNEQTIRKWLTRGLLPGPYWRGNALPYGHPLRRGRNRRWYTEDEFDILFSHRELLRIPLPSLDANPFFDRVRQAFSQLDRGVASSSSMAGLQTQPFATTTLFSEDAIARGVGRFILARGRSEPLEVKVVGNGEGRICQVVLDPDRGMLSKDLFREIEMMLPDDMKLQVCSGVE